MITPQENVTINVKAYKPTQVRPSTYDASIESDPRIHKKTFDNEKEQHLDWEYFKEINNDMLIAHNILVHKILSPITPTNYDEIRFILRMDYFIDNPTIEKLIAFLPNSRFVEFEKADKDELGTSLHPVVYLHPRKTSPTGAYSVWIPHK
jgi:hypothetical protein